MIDKTIFEYIVSLVIKHNITTTKSLDSDGALYNEYYLIDKESQHTIIAVGNNEIFYFDPICYYQYLGGTIFYLDYNDPKLLSKIENVILKYKQFTESGDK